MASSVFYKFKNQKEPERITFHGTGISVFELKREIIAATGLGDGRDFDLHLYPEDDPTNEYIDDTTIILRTHTVIAVRRPAPPGKGKAARYVTGTAPVRAIPTAAKPAAPVAGAGGALTEQDAEAAFLAESAQVWDQQKEALARAKQVHHNYKKKPVNVPNHDPPAGYVCYRCHQKGHWIQLCPTNDDPDFKPVARPKRTTGIPRSFLKTVEKPADEEDARGVMLNAEGEYVQVMTDTRTWEKFQEKANALKAQAAQDNAVNKEAEKRGLACPIDKRMFVDPVKTPCCGKTYCHECIENALADDDLVCPSCATENVLLDDLAADEEMVQKIKEYKAELAKEKAEKEQPKEEAQEAATPSDPNNEDTNSVPPADETAKAGENNGSGSQSPKPSGSSVPESGSNIKSPLTVAAKPASSGTPGASGHGSDSDTSATSKKRKEPPTEIKPPTAPKAMRQQKEQQQRQAQDQTQALIQNFQADMEQMFKQTTNASMPMCMPMAPNPMMAMANAPNMNGMGMNGPMNGFGAMNGNWNNGFNQPFPANMGYGGNMNQGWNNGFPANMGFGNMPNQMNGFNGNWNPNQGYNNMGGGWQGAQMGGGFPNQQRTTFSEQPNQQDAYERKPLNPHRSQNKHRKARAPDFHVL